jgi:hypothetical protein
MSLQEEWLLLQRQHEQYELVALAPKLAALAAVALDARWLLALLLLLWLQDAVLKTFQARLGARLLRLERILREVGVPQGLAMQLHSDWSAVRPRGLNLLAEYARSACRPTVAFPYLLLIILALLSSALTRL